MEAYGEQSYYSREEDNDSITSRDRCSHGVSPHGPPTRGHSSSTETTFKVVFPLYYGD